MGKLNVVGCMGGNGVCLYPFRKQFNIMGNYELRGVFYDKDNKQWNANFPSVNQHREFKKYKKRIDVVIGHPDCGDSSVLRMSRAKKAGDAGNNASILGYIQFIEYHQPNYFLLENLPGFMKVFTEERLEEEFPNYHLKILEGSVSHWGNSQISRKRLVIIGVNKRLDKSYLKYFKLPELDYSQLKFSQEFELGSSNVQTCHVREPASKTCNLYYKDKRQITYLKACEIWNSEFSGQGRWHVGGKMNNQPGVSRNLIDTFPLTVRKQNRQFTTLGLVLSPREMANIQGVPKSFNLYFQENQRIYWINKARLTVTKTMPYEIGKWFAKQVLKASKRDCTVK